jgi:hypothetical protein
MNPSGRGPLAVFFLALLVGVGSLVLRSIRKPRNAIAPDVIDPESEHKETMEYFTMKNAANRAKGEHG